MATSTAKSTSQAGVIFAMKKRYFEDRNFNIDNCGDYVSIAIVLLENFGNKLCNSITEMIYIGERVIIEERAVIISLDGEQGLLPPGMRHY